MQGVVTVLREPHLRLSKHPVADRKPYRVHADAGQEREVGLRDPRVAVRLDGAPQLSRQVLLRRELRRRGRCTFCRRSWSNEPSSILANTTDNS